MESQSNQVLQCYKNFWTRYIDINGRSTRAEYWHPLWINMIITALLGTFSAGILSSLFGIVIFIPAFTVMVRRLHDTSRTMLLAVIAEFSAIITSIVAAVFIFAVLAIAISTESGGFLGFGLVAGVIGAAVVGIIWLYTLFVLASPGKKGPNRYGYDGSCNIKPEVEVQ
ncbi:DUF805 domain-containing protein [Mammaliicoccus sp. Dog046]|uniref:DUF805 domain-containing protein n=1 Tax=Mammaliicoccus sp. Dog046 TaxID=3034233 RepID=UPI002B25E098|nr:DUF805 domain-containing protein [Mammaliicoccus sp. Dog046]WQK85610.1 DUF805 domain-containing protein [Mammaliicoccus sp. Dog046]